MFRMFSASVTLVLILQNFIGTTVSAPQSSSDSTGSRVLGESVTSSSVQPVQSDAKDDDSMEDYLRNVVVNNHKVSEEQGLQKQEEVKNCVYHENVLKNSEIRIRLLWNNIPVLKRIEINLKANQNRENLGVINSRDNNRGGLEIVDSRKGKESLTNDMKYESWEFKLVLNYYNKPHEKPESNKENDGCVTESDINENKKKTIEVDDGTKVGPLDHLRALWWILHGNKQQNTKEEKQSTDNGGSENSNKDSGMKNPNRSYVEKESDVLNKRVTDKVEEGERNENIEKEEVYEKETVDDDNEASESTDQQESIDSDERTLIKCIDCRQNENTKADKDVIRKPEVKLVTIE